MAAAASLYSSSLTHFIAFSANAESTQRGGLRSIEMCPPKSPDTFCSAGDRTFSGLPARSFPSTLIRCAFSSRRLPPSTFDQNQLIPLKLEDGWVADVKIVPKFGRQRLL